MDWDTSMRQLLVHEEARNVSFPQSLPQEMPIADVSFPQSLPQEMPIVEDPVGNQDDRVRVDPESTRGTRRSTRKKTTRDCNNE